MQLFAVAVFTIAALDGSDTVVARGPTRVKALEASLNRTLPKEYATRITLTEGTDFGAKPGTVIFASRETGIAALIAAARAGNNEFSFIYLPRWGA